MPTPERTRARLWGSWGLAGLTALLVGCSAWWLPHPSETLAAHLLRLIVGFAGLIGLLGVIIATQDPAITTALWWAAIGLLIAAGMVGIFSIGVGYLLAAGVLGFALTRLPHAHDRPWWHPRYLCWGIGAFTVAFWGIYLSMLSFR